MKYIQIIVSLFCIFGSIHAKDLTSEIKQYNEDFDKMISNKSYKQACAVLNDSFELNFNFLKYKIVSQRYYELAEKNKDQLGTGLARQQTGRQCWLMGEYDSAFVYYNKATEIFDKINAPLEAFDNYIYIGMLHIALKDYPNAEASYQNAAKYLSGIQPWRIQKHRIAVNNWNLAQAYIKMNKLDKARAYLNTAFNTLSQIDTLPNNFLYTGRAITNFYMGGLQLKLKNYDSSIVYYKHAVILGKTHPNPYIVTNSLSQIGIAFNALKLYDSTIKYGAEGLQLAEKTDNSEYKAVALEALAEAYERKNETGIAYEYYKRFKLVSDSINILDRSIEAYRTKTALESEFKAQNENKLMKYNQFFGLVILLILTFLTYVTYSKSKQTKLLNAELEKSNAAKDKLFSIISHDLRGPLSSFAQISGALNKNIHKFGTAQLSSHLSVLAKSSNAIYNLLESLLSWSKNQIHNVKPEFRESQLRDIANCAINDLTLQSLDKNIQISNETAGDLIINTDADMLRTVLRNLISNSIKFSPNNSVVKITSNLSEDTCEIGVIDSGVGVPPEIANTIFTLDESVRRLGTNREKGAGLGLNLSKKLIEKINGQIGYVNLEPGAKFYIKLDINSRN